MVGFPRILLANVKGDAWFLCRGNWRGGVCPIDHSKARGCWRRVHQRQEARVEAEGLKGSSALQSLLLTQSGLFERVRPLLGAKRTFPATTQTLIPIPQARHAFLLGAMHAAENRSIMLDAMPDDTAAAMRAGRRERLDGTFERVEDHGAVGHPNLEAFVVVVVALLAALIVGVRRRARSRNQATSPGA